MEKAKELLEMPKWKGKEMQMFENLQNKYAEEDAANPLVGLPKQV
jgi:hypothetical protein